MATLTHPAAAPPRRGAVAGARPGRVGRAAARALGWLVLVLAAAALVAGVLVPRLAGATPYTVLTGSMSPTLPVGTLVVVRPVDPDDVRVGDVVTYQLRSGEAVTVTHRVVGVSRGPDGRQWWRTRGDANGAADATPMRPEQLRGELWYAVPHLGRVGLLLEPGTRALAVRLTAAALFAWSALQLRRWWRGREDERLARAERAGSHRGRR